MTRSWHEAVARFVEAPGPLPLHGVVQPYDWGGYDFIRRLAGLELTQGKPCAELWLGDHPSGPASVHLHGVELDLPRLLDVAAEQILGAAAPSRLPYLLKVLDARQMLSIQVHPNKAQAEAGFAREDAQRISLAAPHRSYKDRNHKPEVHVALSDFWMLHGFRKIEDIADTLRAVPELGPLAPDLDQALAAAGPQRERRRQLLRQLYQRAMTLPQAEVDAMLDPLLDRLLPDFHARQLPKDAPDYWACRAAMLRGRAPCDRGLFSFYLLNLLHLQPGQGTYQGAGVLHAYLEGTTVELMAASDNVLRGGLTSKHVDAAGLLETVLFDDGAPEILSGVDRAPGERLYPTPATEFELARLELDDGAPLRRDGGHGPDTLIALECAASAQLVLQADGRPPLVLRRGNAALVPAGLAYDLSCDDRAVLFRAAVPARAEIP